MNAELNYGNVVNFAEARNRHQLRRNRLEVDVKRYQEYLESSDLTEGQKAEFIKALWTVMVAFVDLGYSVHPPQTGGGEIIDIAAGLVARSNGNSDARGIAHV